MHFQNGVWFRNLNGPGFRRQSMRLRNDGGEGESGGEGAGGGGGSPKGESKPDPKPDPKDDPPPEKTFTQSELSAKMAAENRKATSGALKGLADELGMSIEDVKAMVAAKAEAEDGLKSDVEKALESAKKAQADAEAISARALTAERRANVYDALTSAGDDAENPLATLNPQRKDVALTIAEAAMVSFDGDPVDAIAFGAQAVRDQAPELFGEGAKSSGSASSKNGARAPGRTGSEQSPPGGTSAEENAKRMFEQHAPKRIEVGVPSKS